MRQLEHNDLAAGNIVRFGDSTYIVAKRESGSDGILERVELLSWDASNCTTCVSRKHPFTKRIYKYQECEDGDCSCRFTDSCVSYKIPDPKFAIDSIKYVADNVKDYINQLFRKAMKEIK